MMTMTNWYQFKLFVERASGISMDAWHILVGFAAFLLTARLLKSDVSRPLPWLILLGFELLNEAHDFYVERWPDWGSQLGESVKDVVLTMALPTLVAAVARWRPSLLGANTDPERTGDG